MPPPAPVPRGPSFMSTISDSSLELRLGVFPQVGPPIPAPVAPREVLVLDLDSDGPLPFRPGELPEFAPAGPQYAETPAPGSVWLNGDVLMCVCPECKAPLSVRVWLMMASCWRCDTQVELSEQQQREARKLLAEKEQSRPSEARAAAAGPMPASSAAAAVPSPPMPASRPARPAASDSGSAPSAASVSPTSASAAPAAASQSVVARAARPNAQPAGTRRRRRDRGLEDWLSDWLKMMPAWMVSLVFHLVAITILALLTYAPPGEPAQYIVISTAINSPRNEGADVNLQKPEEVNFDLPVPDKDKPKNEKERQTLIKADQDARELRLDPNIDAPALPDLAAVKRSIGSTDPHERMIAARDPRVRVEMVKREGGTTMTEAAVSRALRWMAGEQNPDGSWSLERHGGLRNDVAGTSLVLLPFLGAGQTHQEGVYKDNVAQGLRWLVQRQDKKTGDLRGTNEGNSGMYAHGQATIVLCEAFAMTGDENLRGPAQKALDFIVSGQHSAGGWRYQPREPGDTSVLGWQIMALQSGRAAMLKVPQSTLDLAGNYLDSVQYENGARYYYMPPRQHPDSRTMTAEGLLCRMYLGWNFQEDPALSRGVDYLLDRHLPTQADPDVYYWYYGTQVVHHAGGAQWDKWNARMRDILVTLQEKEGRTAGSWPVLGPHAGPGGRLYMTSLCCATLEVYYRHAPIFRRIKLD